MRRPKVLVIEFGNTKTPLAPSLAMPAKAASSWSARFTSNDSSTMPNDRAAGLAEAGHEPLGHRIADGRHDDRRGRRRFAGSPDGGRAGGDEDVHAQLGQFFGERGKALQLAIGESRLDDDVAAFFLAELAQRLPEGGHEEAVRGGHL